MERISCCGRIQVVPKPNEFGHDVFVIPAFGPITNPRIVLSVFVSQIEELVRVLLYGKHVCSQKMMGTANEQILICRLYAGMLDVSHPDE
jgi:hypothetical protein